VSIKTYKYRLYPNKTQTLLINEQLFEACNLYNVALEQRIRAYKSAQKSLSFYDQSKELKQLRYEKLCGIANFSVSQDVLKRLDKTYKAFFNRIKRGEKAGFPRFKSARRYNTFTYPIYRNGCKLIGNRIYLQGIGNIRIKLHRPVEGVIKTVSITRKNSKYYIAFCCEIPNEPLPVVNKEVGIDMGIENFAVTSDEEFVENPRHYASAKGKNRILHRSVNRKMGGGSNNKKAQHLLSKQKEKIANQRIDFLHKLSTKIVKENDIICIENLNISKMSCSMLSREINNAGWGIFFNMLTYKAENAGRDLIKVNPAGTSQRCNKCGTTVKKDLSVRWHDCPVCGESVHRDLNSALEILRLGTSLCEPTCGISQSVSQKVV